MDDLTANIPIGAKYKSIGRTIGEGDFSLITNLTWTTSELHANYERMKYTPYGERVLAGPCVAAVVVGLTGTSDLRRELSKAGIRLVAMLGMDNVRFPAPVKPNDTLWAETEIVGARATRNPERGVLTMIDRGLNQRGEVVSEATRSALFERVKE